MGVSVQVPSRFVARMLPPLRSALASRMSSCTAHKNSLEQAITRREEGRLTQALHIYISREHENSSWLLAPCWHPTPVEATTEKKKTHLSYFVNLMDWKGRGALLLAVCGGIHELLQAANFGTMYGAAQAAGQHVWLAGDHSCWRHAGEVIVVQHISSNFSDSSLTRPDALRYCSCIISSCA